MLNEEIKWKLIKCLSCGRQYDGSCQIEKCDFCGAYDIIQAWVILDAGWKVCERCGNYYEKSDKDMTGQLLRIKRANPDVIISQAHPADTAILLKQQHDLGINVPHMASSAASMPSVHKLVGNAMEGVYVEAAALANFDPDPGIQAWTKKYVQKFKTRPDSFAILYYDTANFLFEAIKAVGPDRSKIRDWLEKGSYKGLAGRYQFDEEHNGAFFAVIVQYHMRNGEAVPELKKKYDFTPE